ncbi:MAG: hypothetical protein DHS20C16_15250 [Phycisphaerae bacterium]|nr:MAG: hypothetical protein DHS20C16_15250 [Phycisphaerae bacterium]
MVVDNPSAPLAPFLVAPMLEAFIPNGINPSDLYAMRQLPRTACDGMTKDVLRL